MKHSNGNLGVGSLAVIKGSAFVNSNNSKDQSEIQTAMRDSSYRFV
jgi:hypothetical protein